MSRENLVPKTVETKDNPGVVRKDQILAIQVKKHLESGGKPFKQGMNQPDLLFLKRISLKKSGENGPTLEIKDLQCSKH